MICAKEANLQAKTNLYEERKLREIQKATIEFCETYINNVITEASEMGKYFIDIYFGDTDSVKSRSMCLLLTEDGEYADGTTHYTRGDDFLDIQLIKEYLISHCFEVSIYYHSYAIYGLGRGFSGKELRIRWSNVPCEEEAN